MSDEQVDQDLEAIQEQKHTHVSSQEDGSGMDDALEAIFTDPRQKAALLERIGLEESRSDRQTPQNNRLTSSEIFTGGQPYPLWDGYKRMGSHASIIFHPTWLRTSISCLSTGAAWNQDHSVLHPTHPPALCHPRVSQYADTFKSMTHQGTELKKRKHVTPAPKQIGTTPYQNVKKQNEWQMFLIR